MNNENVNEIKRILISLDSSHECMRALEAAVEVASRLRAEIMGLFVEDIHVLNLANLPFARELRSSTATQRQLALVNVERAMKMQAAQLRRRIETLASKAQLRWQFQVSRGDPIAEILAVSPQADIMLMSSMVHAQGNDVHQLILQLTDQISCAVMLCKHSIVKDRPITVFVDKVSPEDIALNLAVILSKAYDTRLKVLYTIDFPTVSHHEENAIRQSIDALKQIIVSKNLHVEFVAVRNRTASELLEELIHHSDGVLVIDKRSTVLKEKDIHQQLINRIRIPVIFAQNKSKL